MPLASDVMDMEDDAATGSPSPRSPTTERSDAGATSDSGEGPEPRDDSDDDEEMVDEAEVPLDRPPRVKKVTVLELKDFYSLFVDRTILRNGGKCKFASLTFNNYRNAGIREKSLLNVFERFWEFPEDNKSCSVAAFQKAMASKKYHDGLCWKKNDEANTPGCGCRNGGFNGIIKAGVQQDLRALTPLFSVQKAPPLREPLRGKPPDELARMLQECLRKLETAARVSCQSVPQAAHGGKRAQAGASAAAGTPARPAAAASGDDTATPPLSPQLKEALRMTDEAEIDRVCGVFDALHASWEDEEPSSPQEVMEKSRTALRTIFASNAAPASLPRPKAKALQALLILERSKKTLTDALLLERSRQREEAQQ